MSEAKIVDADEVASLSEGAVVLDVRLEDDFETARIPGAKNNCVYEVKFLDRMPDAAPDKSAPVCVYGAGAESHESRMAAEKLVRAGYERVLDFRGGLESWRDGRAVEGTGDEPSRPEVRDGEYDIDLDESRIEWTGRNLLSKRCGTVALRAGRLRIEGGQLAGGAFEIDLRRMKCTDLEGDESHDVLIKHLQGDDFFDVERYPTARFAIHESRTLSEGHAGADNLEVRGELELKGVTETVTFPAACGIDSDGRLAAQADFAIDRTLWNVIYGSGRFFHRLGMHVVNDMIDIELKIVTKDR